MASESEPIGSRQRQTLATFGATTFPSRLHIPASARCLALTILATTAVLVALEWAQGFLIPLLIGILLAYTLNPLIVWLELIRVPRAIGASLVMLAVVCALVFGTYSLRGQMQAIIEQLPEAANQLSRGLAKLGEGHLGAMQKVQSAAN
jgi:predicted PurR-regulated permease PerM